MNLIRVVAAAFSVCLSFGSAQASTMTLHDSSLAALGAPRDGLNITRDLTNNLEWLDMTLTTNRTVNNVTSTLLQSGQLLDGWRYASAAEVMALGISAGVPLNYIDPSGFSNAPIPSNTGLTSLLFDLGQLPVFDNLPLFDEIYFFVADVFQAGTHSQGEIRVSQEPRTNRNWLDTGTQGGIFSRNISDSTASAHYGHALVRVSPVPLPAALPLFGTGLGILGFLGWRRRRKAQAV